jgi:hypothetical protein
MDKKQLIALVEHSVSYSLILLTQPIRRVGLKEHVCWKIGLDHSIPNKFIPGTKRTNHRHDSKPHAGNGKWISDKVGSEYRERQASSSPTG